MGRGEKARYLQPYSTACEASPTEGNEDLEPSSLCMVMCVLYQVPQPSLIVHIFMECQDLIKGLMHALLLDTSPASTFLKKNLMEIYVI